MEDFGGDESEASASGVTGSKKLNTVAQINHFLDAKRNVQKPGVEDFFPDLGLF